MGLQQCIRRKRRCFPFFPSLDPRPNWGLPAMPQKEKAPPPVSERKIDTLVPICYRERGGRPAWQWTGQCRQTLVRKKKVLFALWYVPQKFNVSFDLNFTTLKEWKVWTLVLKTKGVSTAASIKENGWKYHWVAFDSILAPFFSAKFFWKWYTFVGKCKKVFALCMESSKNFLRETHSKESEHNQSYKHSAPT